MNDQLPFRLSVLAALGLIWGFWYLPLLDLPQHAAQIATAQDLLRGISPWHELVRLNFFSPYWLGYLPALALSFLMPVALAIKCVMTLGFLGYIHFGTRALAHFRAAPYLRWVLIPSWFGFAWQYGFFTFMAATALVLALLPLIDRYAATPNVKDGRKLALGLPLLYAAHGLAFYFTILLTALFGLFYHYKDIKRLMQAALAPLAGVVLPVLHTIMLLILDPQPDAGDITFNFSGRFERMMKTMTGAGPEPLAFLGVLIALLLPLLGRRNRDHRAAAVPFIAVMLTWFAVPSGFASVGFVYHRFSTFILPFAALLISTAPERKRSQIAHAALMALVWTHLAFQAQRNWDFQAEMADFKQAMAPVPNGQRILNLIDGQFTLSEWGGYRLEQIPAWYQAERQGWVDFNFAVYRPMMVRFSGQLPADQLWKMNDDYRKFDWQTLDAGLYDYFVIMHASPLPADLFASAPCGVDVISQAGWWSVIKPRLCTAP